MRSMTRKLVLSILAVVITVFALGTTTFAWFTLTNTASVSEFEATIVNDTGIEIALDNGGDPTLFNWQSTITAEDVQAYILDAYAGGFRFSDVSSVDGRNFTNLTGSVGSTGGYLALPFHFRSNDITDINVTSMTLSSDTFTWTSGTAFTNEHGQAIVANGAFDVNPADAFRVSFTDVGAVSTVVYENPTSATNVVLGGDGVTPVDLTGTNGSVSFYTAYYGGVGPVGEDSVVTAATVTSMADTHVLTLAADTSANTVYYGTVMIRIWFEGWDANAYNSLLGQVVRTSFNFGVPA